MTESIAVFGFEGPLGRAVSNALARYFHVKALVTAKHQEADNVTEIKNLTVLQIDISSSSKVEEVLQGVSRVFVSTNTDFNSPDGYNEEVRRGQLIAEACSKAGVKHVVLQTALSVVQILGLSSRHMDAKCAVGEIMKRLNLPLTCIITPCFYQDMLHPPLKPKKLPSGSFAFEIAVGTCALDWMSMDDVGDVVAGIFKGIDEYVHKTLSLSANKLSISEITNIFNKHLQTVQFVDKMVTVDQMRCQGYPGASDLANMFDFYCRVDQRTNIHLTKKLNPNLRTFPEWIQDNLSTIKRTFTD